MPTAHLLLEMRKAVEPRAGSSSPSQVAFYNQTLIGMPKSLSSKPPCGGLLGCESLAVPPSRVSHLININVPLVKGCVLPLRFMHLSSFFPKTQASASCLRVIPNPQLAFQSVMSQAVPPSRLTRHHIPGPVVSTRVTCG